MGSSSIPQEVLEVLSERTIGYLSVLSKKGELYSYAVAFHCSDLKVYFMTPVSAAKFKIIKANPTVSFIVDNGKLTLDACGAMIQGKARIFTLGRTFLSLLSIARNIVGFTRKYPGMLIFYARGKGLPDERKIYKYRLIRIDPTKIVYWLGYAFGRYVPKPTVEDDVDIFELAEGEEGISMTARLLQSPEKAFVSERIETDHEWLAKLEETISGESLSEDEKALIKLYKRTGSLEDSRITTKGRIGEEEKKLLEILRKAQPLAKSN